MKKALICGMLGCLCFGGGDWLMLYGDPAYQGSLSWLTKGVAVIPQWRYDLAMALAFPGVVLYGIALFSWMNANGYAAQAQAVCEGLFSQLSWVIPVSEAVMLPVFICWFYLQISGKTVFPRWMAFTSVLVIFAVLKGLTLVMPVSAFRIAFTNGLMSESMVLWFMILMLWEKRMQG